MKDGHLEARDLMLGDLVYGLHDEKYLSSPNYGWHKTIVTDILKVDDMSFGLHRIECSGRECGCVSLKEDNVKPITLTQEILVHNGFSNKGKAGWQNPEYDITYYLESNTFTHNVYKQEQIDIIHNVKYVHELQHALRLCGLNDLADKFKIFYSI